VSSLTGIVALAQTVINAGTAGNAATATGFASVLSGPIGTALGGLMNGLKMTTNDIVSASPRGTVPIGTSQIAFAFARVLSVSSASAIIEFSFINPSTASATLVANTWNINVDLQSADF
jgi:hypothetical protein